jgi:putative hydrolase of the HAD superfamily
VALRGLILDFGGVLTTPMRCNGEAFERSEGLEPGAYFHALNEHPEGVAVYAALEVGDVTQEHWNQVIGRLLGIDPTDLMRRALANLALEPAMVEAVEKARVAGVKTALLSNSFGLEPFNVYADLGVLDLFDVVVLSETEGVRKPDPLIYARTLEQLGLDGADCAFVDDHEANLPPAEALGIATIHHAGDTANVAAQLCELLGPRG